MTLFKSCSSNFKMQKSGTSKASVQSVSLCMSRLTALDKRAMRMRSKKIHVERAFCLPITMSCSLRFTCEKEGSYTKDKITSWVAK